MLPRQFHDVREGDLISFHSQAKVRHGLNGQMLVIKTYETFEPTIVRYRAEVLCEDDNKIRTIALIDCVGA